MTLLGALVLLGASAGIAAAVSGPSISAPTPAASGLFAADLAHAPAPADTTTTAGATPTSTSTPLHSPVTMTRPTASVPAARATTSTVASHPTSTTAAVAVDTPTSLRYPKPPANPTSWSFEANGLAVKIAMTPLAPRVGDTVEFTIETWTTLANETCCNVTLTYANNQVFSRWPPIGPCPKLPIPREERVSYHISEPAVPLFAGVDTPVSMTVRVATTFNPCAGLPGATIFADFNWQVTVGFRAA
ncbi:MAG: hypothetical protein ABIP03_09950 [Aquihabitans sp.]